MGEYVGNGVIYAAVTPERISLRMMRMDTI